MYLLEFKRGKDKKKRKSRKKKLVRNAVIATGLGAAAIGSTALYSRKKVSSPTINTNLPKKGRRSSSKRGNLPVKGKDLRKEVDFLESQSNLIKDREADLKEMRTNRAVALIKENLGSKTRSEITNSKIRRTNNTRSDSARSRSASAYLNRREALERGNAKASGKRKIKNKKRRK